MIIGYTGTRYGMTDPQAHSLEKLLAAHACTVQLAIAYATGCTDRQKGIHGGCCGGDEQFHRICKKLGWEIDVLPGPEVVEAPYFQDADYIYPPEKHMRRNKSIVTSASWMYGAPYEMEEQERGGTWRTIYMARKAKKPLTIVYPDGTFRSENM